MTASAVEHLSVVSTTKGRPVPQEGAPALGDLFFFDFQLSYVQDPGIVILQHAQLGNMGIEMISSSLCFAVSLDFDKRVG